MPIRASSGPFVVTVRSFSRSYRVRSQTSRTPWLTISWVELAQGQTLHLVRSPTQRRAYRIPNLSSFILLGTVSTTCSFTDSPTAATDCMSTSATVRQAASTIFGDAFSTWMRRIGVGGCTLPRLQSRVLQGDRNRPRNSSQVSRHQYKFLVWWYSQPYDKACKAADSYQARFDFISSRCELSMP